MKLQIEIGEPETHEQSGKVWIVHGVKLIHKKYKWAAHAQLFFKEILHMKVS